jgi:putative transposase
MPRKSQFTDEQIIRALKEVDAGAKPADVCRRLGVTEKTYYRWKQKFGGMEVNEAKRLRQRAPSSRSSSPINSCDRALRAVIAVSLTAKRRVPDAEGERCVPRRRRRARQPSLYEPAGDPPEQVGQGQGALAISSTRHSSAAASR